MVEFLATMPFWYWFVFAVILLIVEISTGTTYFLWPAAAAVVVGFADIWPLDGAWRMQFVIFAVVTFLLTIFATPKVKPWLHKSQADHLTLTNAARRKSASASRSRKRSPPAKGACDTATASGSPRARTARISTRAPRLRSSASTAQNCS